MSEGIKDVILDGARSIKQTQITSAPRRDGDLQASIDFKIGRDGFTAVIGPGANAVEIARRRAGSAFAVGPRGIRMSRRNKKLLFQYFKAYWAELGTKGNAKKNIPEQRPRPFIRPSFDVHRGWMRDRANREMRKVMKAVIRQERRGR
jgi:hypothetical protein